MTREEIVDAIREWWREDPKNRAICGHMVDLKKDDGASQGFVAGSKDLIVAALGTSAVSEKNFRVIVLETAQGILTWDHYHEKEKKA